MLVWLLPVRATCFCSALTQTVQEIDDLVNDWTPEPLVASQSSFEEAELEKRPVVVG